MRKLLLLAATLAAPAVASAQTPFINEFSYDCSATNDTGCEFIEVALPTGAAPADYAVYVYNGSGGSVYSGTAGGNDATGTANLPLTGFAVGATNNGFTLYTYTFTTVVNGRFQNGAPDGLALVNTATTTVVEFLSYEGVVTATNGPANATSSTDVGVSQTNATTPTESIGRSGGPGTFAVTTATPGAVNTNQTSLPVELSSFTAAADGSAALLRWTTESETDNAGFSVETLRGATWTEMAFVSGRGTTSERMSYERRIEGLSAGTHRFRLVQRDLDGTATVAATVEVAIGLARAFEVSVSGNATASPRVSLVGRESGTAGVSVFDVRGREVARYAVDAMAGARNEVTVSGLASGVYVVRVGGGPDAASARIVVLR